MKKFIIEPDIQEFELSGQHFSEKYTVYRLRDVSEQSKQWYLDRGYTDKNDIIFVTKNS